MQDFNKFSKEIDRDITRVKKWGIIWGIFSLILGLGLIGFIIWVIVMFMQFFGVI